MINLLNVLFANAIVKLSYKNLQSRHVYVALSVLSTTSQNQFASLMEAWTRDAVDKILVMLRVSMCEAEDGPPTAEQRADTKQASMKLEALQVDRADKRESVNDFWPDCLPGFWDVHQVLWLYC